MSAHELRSLFNVSRCFARISFTQSMDFYCLLSAIPKDKLWCPSGLKWTRYRIFIRRVSLLLSVCAVQWTLPWYCQTSLLLQQPNVRIYSLHILTVCLLHVSLLNSSSSSGRIFFRLNHMLLSELLSIVTAIVVSWFIEGSTTLYLLQ